MHCNLKNREELISRYISGDLPENEAKAFEEHFFGCELCFSQLKAADDALNIIKQEGRSAFHSEKSLEKSNNFLELFSPKRIVFAAAVVTALFLVYILSGPVEKNINDEELKIVEKDSEEENENITQKDFEKSEEKVFADLSGPAFEPNPYIEEWITDNLRSENNIDTIISPLMNDTLSGKINFKWRMIDEGEVFLKIITNNEEIIFSSDQMNSKLNEVEVNEEIFNSSGLYYWRLEDENEVLYIGKFYFIKT